MKTPIDAKALIDAITQGERQVDDLSPEEKQAIRHTHNSADILPGDNLKRTSVKMKVGKSFGTPDGQVAFDSAEAVFVVALPTWAKLANLGDKTATAHRNRDDYKDKPIVQRLFRKYQDDIHSLADFATIPELCGYLRNKKYKRGTLRDWINEIAPGHLKRGRPAKQQK